MSDIVVYGRPDPFWYLASSDFFRGFGSFGNTWVPFVNGPTLGALINANPGGTVRYSKTDKTPLTIVDPLDNQAMAKARIRHDTISTFLQDVVGKEPGLASALQEMSTQNVTWTITIQDSFTQAQKDYLIAKTGSWSNVRAFTILPPGSVLPANYELKTVVLDNYADTRSDFGKILVHEISHVWRNQDGTFHTDESYLLGIENGLYNSVFNSGRTITAVEASIESSNMLGTTSNDIIYATAGNNILNGESGNNTLVSYGGNDFLAAKTGSDYYYVGGLGAKTIKDTGGSADIVYVPWASSVDEIAFGLWDGTLLMASFNEDPVTAPERISILNWGDGYASGVIEKVRYTDDYGVLRTVNLTPIARMALGLENSMTSNSEGVTAQSRGTFGGGDISGSREIENIIGQPLSGYTLHLDVGSPVGPVPIVPEGALVDSLIVQTPIYDHFTVG